MSLYAGFDCSTQGMSAVVIDLEDSGRFEVVFCDALDFDREFPQFATEHGVLPSPVPGLVHAPPLMWAAALDRMLTRVARGIDRGRLRAISGSAQQHGTVYCASAPGELTRKTSPVWMDTSTARECSEIDRALGGSAAVARLTGSRAYPRFSAAQIRKFAREDPAAYAVTHRIHLVSSYLASLLVERHAPIDHADGSGMNLMDLGSRDWSPVMLEATARDLKFRLPPLVRSSAVVGTLGERWQQILDLPPVRVVAWSGDNPCSLVGTGVVNEGQLAISLGTSDTIFAPMSDPRVSANGTGHVFASPIGDYMGITVFRNGSLARERVRDQFGLDWGEFSDALRRTPPGNDGAMMLPWFEPEITPPVSKPDVIRVGLDSAGPDRHVRAIVEAQMIAMARHSAWMGVAPRTIYATGGAAANREILQVMADVFNADVYRFDSTDSAAMGAALRARQADTGLAWNSVADFVKPLAESRVTPIGAHVNVYRRLMASYEALEQSQAPYPPSTC